MLCKQCGYELSEGEKYCPKCGTRVPNKTIELLSADEAREEISSTVSSSVSISDKGNGIYKKNSDIMKNKKVAVISTVSVVVLILIIIFVNMFINRVPNEGKIKTDLVGKSFLVGNDQQYTIKDGEIKKISITKSRIDKKNKIDDVFINLQLSDGKIDMQGDLELTYAYDKGGWVLSDHINNVTNGGFKYTPVTGVEDDFIKKSLIGQDVPISDNENWNINENDIKEIKITDHKSQLKNNTDNITIDLSLQSKNAIATGKVNAIYKFDNKNWALEELKRTDDFKCSFINGLEPNLDKVKIEKDVIGQQILLPNKQAYVIKQEDIKSFNIDSKTLSNSGETLVINSKFQVTNMTLDIEGMMHIDYEYTKEKQWCFKEISSIDTYVETIKVSKQRVYNDLKGMNLSISSKKTSMFSFNYSINPNNIVDWKITGWKMLNPETEEISVYINYNTNPTFNFCAQGIITITYEANSPDWKMTDYSFTQTGWFD
jgi:hypothetical protein